MTKNEIWMHHWQVGETVYFVSTKRVKVGHTTYWQPINIEKITVSSVDIEHEDEGDYAFYEILTIKFSIGKKIVLKRFRSENCLCLSEDLSWHSPMLDERKTNFPYASKSGLPFFTISFSEQDANEMLRNEKTNFSMGVRHDITYYERKIEKAKKHIEDCESWVESLKQIEI